MSTCGVCGERLQSGMGHSCYRPDPDRRPDPERVVFVQPPRIPTAKTWAQLEKLARDYTLSLCRSTGGCSIMQGKQSLLDICLGNADWRSNEIADRLLRRSVEHAINALREEWSR